MPNTKNSKPVPNRARTEPNYEPEDFRGIQEKIGYNFKDKDLLLRALTHISYTNEQKLGYGRCYEKLEFLGDAVLQLVISDYLYMNNTDFREGKLTRFRSGLVSEENLSRISRELGLGQYIFLSKGEHLNGGRDKPSILADIIESLIGAIYLDCATTNQMETVRAFVLKHLKTTIEALDNINNIQDSRSFLYELASRQKWDSIEFKCIDEKGLDHAKQYTYAVYINNIEYGRGVGRTKKKAARIAADNVLKIMGVNKDQIEE